MVYYYKAKVSSSASDELDSEYSDFVVDDPASTSTSNEYTIYMGKDKFENDPLIKKSHPKNLWFHVDKQSSAHIYLQLPLDQQTIKFSDLTLPNDLLIQLGQLTKANSIKGNKLNNVSIIYTPVDNLHTDGSMDTGTVSFHNPQKVKRINIAKRENAIINKLNKTKSEVTTDEFIASQQLMVKEWQSAKKLQEKESEQLRKDQAKVYEEQRRKNADPYADLFDDTVTNANSNEFRNENWVEDEFW